MDAAYLPALSALAGSVIGALASVGTTWLSQRYQARAGEHVRWISQREDLYRDFIVAASKAYGEALISEEPRIEELVALYAMVSRMRVSCSPRTVARAEAVMQVTMGTYFAPNKTIRELHELVRSGAGIDPLKDFAEAVREELRSR
jgi:hypothetical protein